MLFTFGGLVIFFFFFFGNHFKTIYHDHIIRSHLHFIGYLTENADNIPYLRCTFVPGGFVAV